MQEQTADVLPDACGLAFTFDLPLGLTHMRTWLMDEETGEALGACYAYARGPSR